MGNPQDSENLIRIIKEMEKRILDLETRQTIRILRIPADGTFQVPRKSADPSSGMINGDIYYNTATEKFRGYENGAWANLI